MGMDERGVNVDKVEAVLTIVAINVADLGIMSWIDVVRLTLSLRPE